MVVGERAVALADQGGDVVLLLPRPVQQEPRGLGGHVDRGRTVARPAAGRVVRGARVGGREHLVEAVVLEQADQLGAVDQRDRLAGDELVRAGAELAGGDEHGLGGRPVVLERSEEVPHDRRGHRVPVALDLHDHIPAPERVAVDAAHVHPAVLRPGGQLDLHAHRLHQPGYQLLELDRVHLQQELELAHPPCHPAAVRIGVVAEVPEQHPLGAALVGIGIAETVELAAPGHRYSLERTWLTFRQVRVRNGDFRTAWAHPPLGK